MVGGSIHTCIHVHQQSQWTSDQPLNASHTSKRKERIAEALFSLCYETHGNADVRALVAQVRYSPRFVFIDPLPLQERDHPVEAVKMSFFTLWHMYEPPFFTRSTPDVGPFWKTGGCRLSKINKNKKITEEKSSAVMCCYWVALAVCGVMYRPPVWRPLPCVSHHVI